MSLERRLDLPPTLGRSRAATRLGQSLRAEGERWTFYAHRRLAAALAIWRRSVGANFSARAFALACPLLVRPDGCLSASTMSPTERRATVIAHPVTSASRCSPLDPLGTNISLELCASHKIGHHPSYGHEKAWQTPRIRGMRPMIR